MLPAERVVCWIPYVLFCPLCQSYFILQYLNRQGPTSCNKSSNNNNNNNTTTMVRREQSKFTLMPLKENQQQQQQQQQQQHHGSTRSNSTVAARSSSNQGQRDNNGGINNMNNINKNKLNNRRMTAAAVLAPDCTSLENQNQLQKQQQQQQSSELRPLPGGVVVGFHGLPPMKKSSSVAATATTTTSRLDVVDDRQSSSSSISPLLLPLVDEMQQRRLAKTLAVNSTSAATTIADNDDERVVTASSVTNNNNNMNTSSSLSFATNSSLAPTTPTAAPTVPVSSVQGQQCRRSLLRYGERMQDLFGLDQDCSPQYWNDCQTLVDNASLSNSNSSSMTDNSDSAALWRSILDYASRYRCSNDPSNSNSSSSSRNLLSGQGLIKLHRRATSRLSSSSSTTAATTTKTIVVDENVLAIWLSYARAQLRHGSNVNDARLTLRHIQQWMVTNNNSNNDDNDESSSSKKASMFLCNHPDYKQLLSELNDNNNNKPLDQCSSLDVQGGDDGKDERKPLLEQKLPPKKRVVVGNDESSSSLSPKRQKQESTGGVCCASSSSFHAPPPHAATTTAAAEEQSQCSDMSLETSQETFDGDVSLELNDNYESKDDDSVRLLSLQPTTVAPHRQTMMTTATTTAAVSQRRQENNCSISQQQQVANEENSTPVLEPTESSSQTNATAQDGSAKDKKSLLVPRSQVVPQKNVTANNHHLLGSTSSLLPPVTDHPRHMSTAKDGTNGGPSFATENDKVSVAPDLSTKVTTKTNSLVAVAAAADEPRPPGLTAAKSCDVVASATPSSTWLQNRPPRATTLRSEGALKIGRPPLRFSSKAPGGVVSRLGKLGKPKRVDPGTTSLDIDNGSDDDDNTESSNVASTSAVSNSNNNKQQSSKVPKMDLSYIYEWDPTKRICGDATKAKEKPVESSCKNVKEKNKPPAPLLPKIDEASTLASEENSGAAAATAAVCKFDHDRQQVVVTTDSAEKHIKTGNDNSGNSSDKKPRSKENPLLANANVDFLPLVSEKNILHVNGVPFAKLGVVGKGGSCKVYRVLSKECSVVAIKKVKLDGMDKRAIDSYANEINLLKSLRGNPAIIQMYDSQVDLHRKAIFVVMELGEVDLNQVLQQESLLADKHSDGEGRRLNLNFIRLTWQQMLSAVHSIHEARIIHGDLKPANFLFVRGALKLIDFGIAKAMSNDNTTNIYRDSQIGTLNYMSPEAILDSGAGNGNKPKLKMGRASDIWSLGCILYQMVYGKTPFADLRMIPKLHAITDPDHCIDFPDYADPDAIDAMRKCLRRKPEERPPIIGTGGLLDQHCFLHSSRRLRRGGNV